MNLILILFLISLIILFFYRLKISNKPRNKNLFKFKKKLLSKESNIEKIFSRDDEKTASNPNIDIKIGLYDKEENIARKSNIHRARLSKFNKSKFNGEMIFLDKDLKIFKYINGQKKYI